MTSLLLRPRAIGVSVLLVSFLVLASGPCLAQSAAVKKQAKAKLLEGDALLKEGEFRQALARFQEAHALIPSAKLEYNFGLAYDGLGRDAEALRSYERFLSEAPEAPGTARRYAEERRSRLLATVARLVITTPFEGAEVFVDGSSHGKTPLGRSIYVDATPHQVTLQRQEGPPLVRRVEPKPGEEVSIAFQAEASAAAAVPPPVPPRAADAPRPPRPPLEPRRPEERPSSPLRRTAALWTGGA